jgi:hypothetical protein
MKRPGNNPKRRIASANRLTKAERAALADSVRYAASGHHKRNPADYGLARTSPRPTKSLCDLLKVVTLEEAKALIQKGITYGIVSDFSFGNFPKYIWCVDADGEVYEAKTNPVTPGVYHGYRLEKEDNMRGYILNVWKERCPQAGP